eukprot:CAMPEP_0119566630 /NCGR_PEP_ID=MMETSP1352-20130426/33639_1 /TAXON_ID=265584 /ORGANISM="Stauroneis constricta, Strain CCMP1120" /LENGTH=123 /DNA_ID=CAMNT_0007615773 /DNA_START=136 /DNA_END=504 /DNA_ORIENTATION=-
MKQYFDYCLKRGNQTQDGLSIRFKDNPNPTVREFKSKLISDGDLKCAESEVQIYPPGEKTKQCGDDEKLAVLVKTYGTQSFLVVAPDPLRSAYKGNTCEVSASTLNKTSDPEKEKFHRETVSK